MVTHAVTGGAALSLLEAKVNHDLDALNAVLTAFPIEEIVYSAVTLAVHLAFRAAHGFIDEATDRLASESRDGGISHILGIALNEGDHFDDPDVARSSRVYIARDQFLGSIIGTTSTWDGDYRPEVTIHFFPGWDTAQWSAEVAQGVALALEAVMFLDVLTKLGETPTDADIREERARQFESYRRSIARSFT